LDTVRGLRLVRRSQLRQQSGDRPAMEVVAQPVSPRPGGLVQEDVDTDRTRTDIGEFPCGEALLRSQSRSQILHEDVGLLR
jgi:hypothetical protein